MSTTTTTTTAAPTVAQTSWADSPLPLLKTHLGAKAKLSGPDVHAADVMAHTMAHLHNMVLRGFNSVWQQAPYVSEEVDIKDFLQYCKLVHHALHHHHDVEEQFFFPEVEKFIQKPGYMEGNVEQHRAFEEGLDRFGKYVENVTPQTYDGYKIREIIDSFGHILATHLNDEIKTLLDLRQYDSKALLDIWHKSGAYARGSDDPKDAMPLMIGVYDVTYEGGASSEFNFPFFLYWINDFVFSRKHGNRVWRFTPCNSRGVPRELAFGPAKDEK